MGRCGWWGGVRGLRGWGWGAGVRVRVREYILVVGVGCLRGSILSPSTPGVSADLCGCRQAAADPRV